MVKLPTILILFLLASCHYKKTTWKTLDFGVFTIKTPPSWKKIKLNGTDSYVGSITNARDTLSFDYGQFSMEVGQEDSILHRFEKDTINGLITFLAIPIKEKYGYIRMSLTVNHHDKFSISGHNVENIDTILKIYRSIVFNDADTTFNSKMEGPGKSLFMAKCASCHPVSKKAEGLALKDAMQQRNVDWLYSFFTRRELVEKDSLHKALQEIYGNMTCMTFPSITKKEIEEIKDYVEGY